MNPTKEEMTAMVDEYEMHLQNGVPWRDALQLSGLKKKSLYSYRKKLGRVANLSGLHDRYQRICDHVEKRIEESPTKTIADILKEIGVSRTTHDTARKKLGRPSVTRPPEALHQMFSNAGKKTSLPIERYRETVDCVDSVVDETSVTAKDACTIVGITEQTYYYARKKLGIGPAGRRNWKHTETLTYKPGNQLIPGIYGLINIETVIGIEARNIAWKFKGRADEEEMRKILHQRILSMTGGKVKVKF